MKPFTETDTLMLRPWIVAVALGVTIVIDGWRPRGASFFEGNEPPCD